jgi:hypothetical protein
MQFVDIPALESNLRENSFYVRRHGAKPVRKVVRGSRRWIYPRTA